MSTFEEQAKQIIAKRQEDLDGVAKAGYQARVAGMKAYQIKADSDNALQVNATEAQVVGKLTKEAVRPPVVSAEQGALARERIRSHGFVGAVAHAEKIGDSEMSLALAAEGQWLKGRTDSSLSSSLQADAPVDAETAHAVKMANKAAFKSRSAADQKLIIAAEKAHADAIAADAYAAGHSAATIAQALRLRTDR